MVPYDWMLVQAPRPVPRFTPLSPAYTQALVEPPHCWVNVVFGQESSALWVFG